MVNGMTTFRSSLPAQRHDDVCLLPFAFLPFGVCGVGEGRVDLGNASFLTTAFFSGVCGVLLPG